MKNLIPSLSLLLLILTSCGQSKLSNEEALATLQAEYQNNCYGWTKLRSIEGWDNHIEFINSINQLAMDEYAEVSQRQVMNGSGRYKQEVSWKFTQKGKDELTKDRTRAHATTKAKVVSILGISHNEDNNEAVVRFIYNRVESPLFPLKHQSNKCTLGQFEDEATLIRYDTGWKLKQPEASNNPLY